MQEEIKDAAYAPDVATPVIVKHDVVPSRDQAKKEILNTLSREKRIPKKLVGHAFELLSNVKTSKAEDATKDEVWELISKFGGDPYLRWKLSRHSYEERERLLWGPASKLEAHIETRVEHLLAKGRQISLRQLTKEVEFYLGVPPGVGRPVAKRVIHRVRCRHRLFRSERRVKYMFDKFDIAADDFNELADAGVLKPSTPKPVLVVVGRVLKQLYHGSHRLRCRIA